MINKHFTQKGRVESLQKLAQKSEGLMIRNQLFGSKLASTQVLRGLSYYWMIRMYLTVKLKNRKRSCSNWLIMVMMMTMTQMRRSSSIIGKNHSTNWKPALWSSMLGNLPSCATTLQRNFVESRKSINWDRDVACKNKIQTRTALLMPLSQKLTQSSLTDWPIKHSHSSMLTNEALYLICCFYVYVAKNDFNP
jgi:hypothetical protein